MALAAGSCVRACALHAQAHTAGSEMMPLMAAFVVVMVVVTVSAAAIVVTTAVPLGAVQFARAGTGPHARSGETRHHQHCCSAYCRQLQESSWISVMKKKNKIRKRVNRPASQILRALAERPYGLG